MRRAPIPTGRRDTVHTNTNQKRRAVRSALLLFLAAAACCAGIWGYRLTHTPRVLLTRAAARTFSAEALGFPPEEALSLLRGGRWEHRFSLQLYRLVPSDRFREDYPLLSGLRFLEGLGADGSGILCFPESLAVSGASLSYLQKPYCHLDCAASADTLFLRVPELSGSYIAVRPAHLGKDWNRSPLAALCGVTLPEDAGFSLFPEALRPGEDAGSPSDLAALSGLLSSLYEASEVTLLPEEGGAEAQVFQVTMPQEPLRALWEALLPGLSKAGVLPVSYEPILATRSPEGLLTRIEWNVTVSDGQERLPLQLSVQPDGGRFLLSCRVSPPDREPVQAVLDARLSGQEGGALAVELEELTVRGAPGSLTLTGSLTLSPAGETPTLPAAEETLPVLSLPLPDLLRFGGELAKHLERSDLRIWKGFLP